MLVSFGLVSLRPFVFGEWWWRGVLFWCRRRRMSRYRFRWEWIVFRRWWWLVSVSSFAATKTTTMMTTKDRPQKKTFPNSPEKTKTTNSPRRTKAPSPPVPLPLLPPPYHYHYQSTSPTGSGPQTQSDSLSTVLRNYSPHNPSARLDLSIVPQKLVHVPL